MLLPVLFIINRKLNFVRNVSHNLLAFTWWYGNKCKYAKCPQAYYYLKIHKFHRISTRGSQWLKKKKKKKKNTLNKITVLHMAFLYKTYIQNILIQMCPKSFLLEPSISHCISNTEIKLHFACKLPILMAFQYKNSRIYFFIIWKLIVI